MMPIETKVKAGTAATLAAAVTVAVLNATLADSSLLGSLPSWLQAVFLAAGPPVVTFASAWQAKHSPRGPQ